MTTPISPSQVHFGGIKDWSARKVATVAAAVTAGLVAPVAVAGTNAVVHAGSKEASSVVRTIGVDCFDAAGKKVAASTAKTTEDKGMTAINAVDACTQQGVLEVPRVGRTEPGKSSYITAFSTPDTPEILVVASRDGKRWVGNGPLSGGVSPDDVSPFLVTPSQAGQRYSVKLQDMTVHTPKTETPYDSEVEGTYYWGRDKAKKTNNIEVSVDDREFGQGAQAQLGSSYHVLNRDTGGATISEPSAESITLDGKGGFSVLHEGGRKKPQ